MSWIGRALAVAALALLAACAEATPEGPEAVAGPLPGKAAVVFFRPAHLDKAGDKAGAAPVLDVSGDAAVLVGVVPAGRKLVYFSDPGRRRFMVAGAAPDFMDAELAAGRIYYARVAPDAAGRKARFALRATAANDLALAGALADCAWMSEAEASRDWTPARLADAERKKAEYLPAWLAAPQGPVLTGEGPR